MKRLIIIAMLAVSFAACKNSHTPDVSGIKVDVSIGRFDRDFFTADSVHMDQSMFGLQKKYPYFFSDFIQNVVLVDISDTSIPVTTAINQYRDHVRPIYDSIQLKFPNLGGLDEELKQDFRFVKYYYPAYKLPKVITYAGLIGDPSVALTRDALAIGLQMFLGRNFSAYNRQEAIDKFPLYISRRFEPQYIAVNCIQNIALDIYPDRTQGLSLIEQMIEKGKQWYMNDLFLPTTADSLKTGYTQSQLDWCKANEGMIWSYILQTNDMYTTEPTIIQNYVGEAPKTDGMPDASPGNVGQWIGWQIVKTYVAKTGATLQQVLQTDAKKIFEDAKYKPK